MFLLPYELKFKMMHVFEVRFLYFRENKAELYFFVLVRLNSADLRRNSQWLNLTTENHNPKDEHDVNGELLYKTLLLWQIPLPFFSETKSVTPNFFSIFGVSSVWPNSRRQMKKISP